MMRSESGDRLSGITTAWTLINAAHGGPEDEARSARGDLMRRYGGAAYRYLLGALRDPEAAEELSQEFALRLVRGDFRRADPRWGRFRNFVKAALFHLIIDYKKRERRRPLSLAPGGPADPLRGPDPSFERGWSDELLAQAWQALASAPGRGDRAHYAVLRFRAEHPEMPSEEIAGRLEERLGRPMTAAGARQAICRARARFAELLVDEVARSLGSPAPDELEQELIDLGLLRYCRPALLRRRRGGG